MNLQSHSWTYYLEKIRIEKDTCTPIFIEIMFTIAKTWKQSKFSLTDE